ncbi:M64 family metallopeptidase [Solirubrobacter soli]|uniref:M64 family metallopeptidase n=1 Tax=Solirubrobacter soli TaxID=363832 RepID=UPI0004289AA4|nr:M64 family metallopeptidase [Solirubrobacter soli]
MRSGRSALALAATALGLVAAAAPAAHAQAVGSATVVPVQVTGPPSERLNLVILGDGYTAGEMQKFRDQVDKHLNIQWSIEPYRSYRDYFNVYRIEVVSGVSGISCDPDDGNVRRDTPLHLQYAGTCPAAFDARGITFGTGGSAALNQYVAMIPGVTTANRQTLTLANTNTYGGIGGGDATTSGGSPQGPLISPHELGHSLGGLQDEYPYSARNVPGGRYTGGEPSSIHHTIATVQQMLDGHLKWWRWLGEDSESGGKIDRFESGNLFSSNIWRPSQHSIMRWLGNHYDQVGRERMTQRISGRRASNAMSVISTPQGNVGPTDVVWLETGHPGFQQLDTVWKRNGTEIPNTADSRNLELSKVTGLTAGDTITATVVDPTAFVRDPAVRDSTSMTQTRTWTVGSTPTAPGTPGAPVFTSSTPTNRPVARDAEVFTETSHPVDHVLTVTFKLDGVTQPNPANSRNFKLANLTAGDHTLSATVTDPKAPDLGSDTRTWTVDNSDPTTTATLSTPLSSQPHNIYFEQFTMGITAQDESPGYVTPEFRLDHDGWFNYFGWPDASAGTPYLFTPRGTDIKNLTYGSLGSGGMSKAPFEQSYPDFKPGYGTHTVEHHAIDAAGNVGPATEYSATVIPGAKPACTTTITGARAGSVVADSGVTCLDKAQVGGDVIVKTGASVVSTGSSITGRLDAGGANAVQLIDTTVLGSTSIANTLGDVTLVHSKLNGGANLTGNDSGTYGVKLVANTIYVGLTCTQNKVGVFDFGAANSVGGPKSGDCATLTGEPPLVQTPVDGGVGGSVGATLSLSLGAPASFGAFTPGLAKDYTASTTANVVSTAADAVLSVADAGVNATGHLVNGTFALPQALQARGRRGGQAGADFAAVGGAPLSLVTWTQPVANDPVSIDFKQSIGASDALRTGTYAKTLTFTLSTTNP